MQRVVGHTTAWTLVCELIAKIQRHMQIDLDLRSLDRLHKVGTDVCKCVKHATLR